MTFPVLERHPAAPTEAASRVMFPVSEIESLAPPAQLVESLNTPHPRFAVAFPVILMAPAAFCPVAVFPNASRQFPDLLLSRTAVALTELGRTEKKMLEKIAVCGREIVTWTAGSDAKVVAVAATLA